MGQTILTPYQSQVLGLIKKDPIITDRFYFTGGTALAEYYLKHRYSEDLDFFSRDQVNFEQTRTFISSLKADLPIKETQERSIAGLYMYTLTFSDGTILRIDFNEYDHPQIEYSSLMFGNLKIDSLYDIAVNKLASILGRAKVRDFIDLYFCIKQEGYFWEQLFDRLRDKFGISFEETTIGSQFAKVQDLTDYPRMLVPFARKDLIDFYLSEAKKLEPKIFK